jgi:hypothetical protein
MNFTSCHINNSANNAVYAMLMVNNIFISFNLSQGLYVPDKNSVSSHDEKVPEK